MEQPHKDADRFRNFLAFALIGTFISVIPLFVFKTIPEPNKDIITYMVGQLSGMALTALGFYFVNKAGQDALDNKRADNTGKLADAVVAASASTPATDGAGKAADAVVDAAADKADEIKHGGGV
jgi:hypothetical protein